MRTVFVADSEKAEVDRIANEKSLEEEGRKKAEAKRKAEAEHEAAAQAEKERKANAEKARWRTWSDKAGTFKIEAKFLGLVDNDVVLKKHDGKTTRVALEELSPDDQAWVEQWKKLHSNSR
jgi:regulator of protease activity HflC (stomatin/prohibitin superfamily)